MDTHFQEEPLEPEATSTERALCLGLTPVLRASFGEKIKRSWIKETLGVPANHPENSALDSFEDLDIKVLEELPAEGADNDLETEPKEEPEEAPHATSNGGRPDASA